MPFDERIASQEAEHFLSETLIRNLRVRGVVVGSTFRFGHRRMGDAALMTAVFERGGVTFVPVTNTTDEFGERISSTRIRSLIAQGKLDQADAMLGHSYELRGQVVLGAGRGHDLGFPTANIGVPGKLLPEGRRLFGDGAL